MSASARSCRSLDAGRLRGTYGLAVAGYDAAVEACNQTVVGAVQDVAEQVASLKSLAIQQASAEHAAASADRSTAWSTRAIAAA